MKTVRIVDNLFGSNINTIKLAALYFDKIELIEHIDNIGFTSDIPNTSYATPDFKAHIHPLIHEQVVTLESNTDLKFLTDTNGSWGINDERVLKFFEPHIDVFFKKGTFRKKITWGKEEPGGHYYFKPLGKLKSEVKGVFRAYNQDFIENSPFGVVYYSLLLSSTLSSIDKGYQTLTSSKILNELLVRFFNSTTYLDAKKNILRELKVNPKVAFEALKIALPNVSHLSMEDILELRLRLKDELIAFRNHLQDIHLNLHSFNEFDLAINAREIAKSKIKPALDDLTRRAMDVKTIIPAKALQELKDPKSYSPLLLTFTENISNTFAILVSLGVISLNTALEYFKETKDVKSNGLYYLLKLQEHN